MMVSPLYRQFGFSLKELFRCYDNIPIICYSRGGTNNIDGVGKSCANSLDHVNHVGKTYMVRMDFLMENK